ncbi:TPA: hypothetical protein N2D99_002467 [Clostridium botulinum]|nr:hypothetical protein [Clostridium botulinum]
MFFKNEKHRKLFEELVKETECNKKEQAILYLLTSIEAIQEKLNNFYAIEVMKKHKVEGFIVLDNLNTVKDLKVSERMAIAVAFNLFNGIDITEQLDLKKYGYNLNTYGVRCCMRSEFPVYTEALQLLA